ncbi:PAS domain-containing protein [uncultured Brachyspira sp.]|uniref:helix-turn-helix transcriptional regulator n=1 Tax=uncultured Brachyspira sp. TaxID=221953 RepID=UPI00261E8323|nr:PAS domain-containing protein [uncultured Brachyspira sp.]
MDNYTKSGSVVLDDTDRAIIQSYENAVKGIANIFGTYCEVLVHSLDNYEHAVLFIENGHNSSRDVGAPITDLALELINSVHKDKKFLESYESKFPNGDRCKSVTIPIKNKDKLIGLLCININMEVSLIDFMREFSINKNDSEEHTHSENYSSNIDDMIKSILNKNINDIILDMSIPNQEKNKQIILKLHKIGFFQLKGSVEALAEKLHISVHTVYSNIRKYT